MNKTTIPTSLLLAAVVLAAGCLSPADRDKVHDVAKDDLVDKHFQFACDFATSGQDGVHVELRECDSGRLGSGNIPSVDMTVNGQKDVGTWRVNRQAEVTVTVYFPTPIGNAKPHTFSYSVEHGKTGSFELAGKIPVNHDEGPVLGTYDVCFVLGGFKDASTWKPGFQGKSDPTQPVPTCIHYKIGTKLL